MKLNIPGLQDATLLTLIDPDEWAAAKWRATVFFYATDPVPAHVPPGLGIAFLNFDAGKKIFGGWLKRLGRFDPANELRISIVEGPIPSDPSGYTVFVSTNPVKAPDGSPLPDGATFVRFAQLNRMSPAPGPPHLRMFKQHFAKTRRYRLFPAHFDGTQIKSFDMDCHIEKTQLNFLHVSN